MTKDKIDKLKVKAYDLAKQRASEIVKAEPFLVKAKQLEQSLVELNGKIKKMEKET